MKFLKIDIRAVAVRESAVPPPPPARTAKNQRTMTATTVAEEITPDHSRDPDPGTTNLVRAGREERTATEPPKIRNVRDNLTEPDKKSVLETGP